MGLVGIYDYFIGVAGSFNAANFNFFFSSIIIAI